MFQTFTLAVLKTYPLIILNTYSYHYYSECEITTCIVALVLLDIVLRRQSRVDKICNWYKNLLEISSKLWENITKPAGKMLKLSSWSSSITMGSENVLVVLLGCSPTKLLAMILRKFHTFLWSNYWENWYPYKLSGPVISY